MKNKAAAITVLILSTTATGARAEYLVRSPMVEENVLGTEYLGDYSTDGKNALNNGRHDVGELSFGATNWWKPVIEGNWTRDPGAGNTERFASSVFASQFQLTPHHSELFDAGLWVEYAQSGRSGDTDTVKFGPLLHKDVGHVSLTANFYLENEVGSHATGASDATYNTQIKYEVKPWLSPAIEAYGDLGAIHHVTSYQDLQTLAGPVLLGELPVTHASALKYEVGYLAGLSSAASENTIKWRLEYEVEF